jgi:hypothetical protein
MRRTLSALATAAALSIAVAAIPQSAQAAPKHHHWHGGGAFLGGLAAGAIMGGALSGPGYYGYYGGPGYYGGYGQCWRERVWTEYGWRWRRFCN